MNELTNIPAYQEFRGPKEALGFILSLAGALPDHSTAAYDVDRILEVIDLESDGGDFCHRDSNMAAKESAA